MTLKHIRSILRIPANEPGIDDAGERSEAQSLYDEAPTHEGTDSTESTEPTEGSDESTTGEGAGDGTTTPADNRVLKLDPETIAALRQQAAPAEQSRVPEMTPEQLRSLLNPVEIRADSELLKIFAPESTPEQKMKALQDFANSIVKNTSSINRLMLERQQREFEARLTPVQQAQMAAQANEYKSTFFKQNSDLAKYENVVKMAANSTSEFKIVNGQRVAKSAQEIMKEVSDTTRSTLKSLGITLPASPSAVSGKPGSTVPRPNVLSDTGRSGGGAGSGKGTANNPDADIYARG